MESLSEDGGGGAALAEEGAVHHYEGLRALSPAEFVRGQRAADDEHRLDHDAEAVVDVVRVESRWLSGVGLININDIRGKIRNFLSHTCRLGREGP